MRPTSWKYIATYETFVIVGILIIIGASVKLAGFYDFPSDWFWFLAGIGLVVESIIALSKEKTFKNKYK